MSEERKKVLEMLAAGKITADEAERLLERLDGGGAGRGEGRGRHWRRHLHQHRHGDRDATASAIAGPDTAPPGTEDDDAPRPLPRYLRVQVDGRGGETVNIRVPLKLVRTGIKLGAMLPRDARAKLEAKGIDLESFSGLEADELIDALRELTVDVQDGDDNVRIFTE